MKYIALLCALLASGMQVQAQEMLKISREEAETMFLQNNLQLISGQLNIESQKAEVLQAKLWPNPQFSISEVNLWATERQRGGQEVSPPLWNNFGRNQQFSFELQQLVQTAGKRKKLIALEQVDVSKSVEYFEDLLRNLKLEFRNLLTDLQYIQRAIKVHQNLIDNISILANAYKNQLDKGNISKAEYTRLKAQELEINRKILELTRQSNEIQKELKVLLRRAPTTIIEIEDDGFVIDTHPYETISISQILERAHENRPDYKIALLQEDFSDKRLSYEKSKRIPDMTFGLNYDRNGSTMLDFVGVGVTFDLPVFNRNKGNIQKAIIGIEQAKIHKEQVLNTIENEIGLAYTSLLQAISFIKQIDADYESNLDLLLENYTKNFTSRNVSMLEYLDFMNAYLENKIIILDAQKQVNIKAEELNYSIGKDFNN